MYKQASISRYLKHNLKLKLWIWDYGLYIPLLKKVSQLRCVFWTVHGINSINVNSPWPTTMCIYLRNAHCQRCVQCCFFYFKVTCIESLLELFWYLCLWNIYLTVRFFFVWWYKHTIPPHLVDRSSIYVLYFFWYAGLEEVFYIDRLLSFNFRYLKVYL